MQSAVGKKAFSSVEESAGKTKRLERLPHSRRTGRILSTFLLHPDVRRTQLTQ